jgi:hypothetical protein
LWNNTIFDVYYGVLQKKGHATIQPLITPATPLFFLSLSLSLSAFSLRFSAPFAV